MGGYSKEGMQFVLLYKECVEVGFPMTPSGDGQEDSRPFIADLSPVASDASS